MSGKRGWRWLLALCLSPATAAVAAANAPQAPRAVWIWEQPSYAMLDSTHVADEALRFFHDARIGILYLYADAYAGRQPIVEQPQHYRTFIRNAHARGIRVHALLGSWYLHTERYVLPEQQLRAVAMLQRVLDYNAAAAPDERFDGVNYDIEPHRMDEWNDASRAELLRGFLDMSTAMMAAKRKSGQALPIGPSMPFWWDGIELDWHGARKPVSQHVLDTVDDAALMDYRNRAEGGDGILAHAQDEMDYAERIGKRVEIGLEFNPAEPAKLSFHGMTPAAFEAEARKVEAAYRAQPAFAGFVLHHYLGYRCFVGQPPPGPDACKGEAAADAR